METAHLIQEARASREALMEGVARSREARQLTSQMRRRVDETRKASSEQSRHFSETYWWLAKWSQDARASDCAPGLINGGKPPRAVAVLALPSKRYAGAHLLSHLIPDSLRASSVTAVIIPQKSTTIRYVDAMNQLFCDLGFVEHRHESPGEEAIW